MPPPADDIRIRRLEPADSLAELTDLLHRAYAPLAAMGLRYWATHQSVADTRTRAESGECWVAVRAGRLVGTVLFRTADRTEGCPWYERPDVASFGQLAVEPALQGRGLGRRLVDLAERRARETGAAEIALDTSEGALHLIELYQRWGYRLVGRADWRPAVNYESVILSRRLGR